MNFFRLFCAVLGAGLLSSASFAAETANWWLTSLDKTALLGEQTPALIFTRAGSETTGGIVVNPDRRYQTIDGFGFALTGGSAGYLVNLPSAERKKLLAELFSSEGNGIGISYLRVSIGSSDLNDRVFSYDDLPPGQTDAGMEHFNLCDDLLNVVPVLKEILAINPRIKILGSPWSAPIWMKTNGNIQGGKLKEEFYPAYALYFARYIKAMAAEGIPIDAVTVQNEPFNDGNTPSMQLFAKEEALFIKRDLGPMFEREGIKTKIVLYDHNCDAPEYPVSILTDPDARRFVNGSGFHLYAGPITAMSVVHDRFPDKALYFTEMMTVNRHEFRISQPVARILIGATRNWSRNVILWNLAANSQFQPHTDNGGCAMCQGAISIDGSTITRNLAYYVIGHAAKFVPAGSVRIESTDDPGLPNVAFRTPENKTVLIVANLGDVSRKFPIVCAGKTIEAEIGSGGAATFVW